MDGWQFILPLFYSFFISDVYFVPCLSCVLLEHSNFPSVGINKVFSIINLFNNNQYMYNYLFHFFFNDEF